MVLFLPYFLIYPVVMFFTDALYLVFLLVCLVPFIVDILLTDWPIVYNCEPLDRENGTVQAMEGQYVT